MSQLKTDEEIVESTKYNFTLKVDKLLDNSTTTRRAKRQQRVPESNLNYVPRPQNPFILYRRDMVATCEIRIYRTKIIRNFKKIGQMWKNEPVEVMPWQDW